MSVRLYSVDASWLRVFTAAQHENFANSGSKRKPVVKVIIQIPEAEKYGQGVGKDTFL